MVSTCTKKLHRMTPENTGNYEQKVKGARIVRYCIACKKRAPATYKTHKTNDPIEVTEEMLEATGQWSIPKVSMTESGRYYYA